MPKLRDKPEESKFYDKGLKFTCQEGCSRCCGGAPGYVWLKGEDAVKISRHLGITVDEFIENYTKDVSGELSLIDKPDDNWNCIMLKDGLCTIYEQRPIQCRTYPFWYSNISHEDMWDNTKDECPGIGEGRTFTKKEIESIADNEQTIDSVKSS